MAKPLPFNEQSVFDRIKEYRQRIYKSNEDLPPKVLELYNKLLSSRGKTINPEVYETPLPYKNIGVGTALSKRFADRFNRGGFANSGLTNSEKLANQLTVVNRKTRLDSAAQTASDKYSFDAYNNLFSQYIGNLNAESNYKFQSVEGNKQKLHAIDHAVAKQFKDDYSKYQLY
jgi:hypothetical protein